MLGLVVLGASDPRSETHVTLFWPQWLFGIQSPGYGLGHSISYLLHGDVFKSFETHWIGIPVVIVMVHRIVTLIARKIRYSEIRR